MIIKTYDTNGNILSNNYKVGDEIYHCRHHNMIITEIDEENETFKATHEYKFSNKILSKNDISYFYTDTAYKEYLNKL